MISAKKLLYKTIEVLGAHKDFVIEEGATADASPWRYRKWNSGRLDAERAWNIGQVTIGTAELENTVMVSSSVTANLPSMAVSGSLEISLMGTSSNSPIFMERIGTRDFRLAKVGSASVTLQNVTVAVRTVGARWKA